MKEKLLQIVAAAWAFLQQPVRLPRRAAPAGIPVAHRPGLMRFPTTAFLPSRLHEADLPGHPMTINGDWDYVTLPPPRRELMKPQTWLAGRQRALVPKMKSYLWPRATGFGFTQQQRKAYPIPKMTPSNLRYFSNTPYARHAINLIKNEIMGLEWEIVPEDDGREPSAEEKQQIDLITACLKKPNRDDSFESFIGKVVEDILAVSAGAYEQEVGTDPVRPLFLWPVDGSSIQIFAGWDGEKSQARYMQTVGYSNVGTVQGICLRNDELVYLKPNDTTAHPYSCGPLETAFNTISRLLGAKEAAGNQASNAQPENLIAITGADDNYINALRMYFRDEIEAQGQTPMVGGSMVQNLEVHKLRTASDDALYLKWQEVCVRELGVAFQLSPLAMSLERDVSKNPSETMDDRDWDHAVLPHARSLQGDITRHTVQQRMGFATLKFRFKNLKRRNETEEVKRYAELYKANAITPNQYRFSVGQPPLKSQWGDMLFVDTQIAVIAARGTAVIEDPDFQDDGFHPAPEPTPKPKKATKQKAEGGGMTAAEQRSMQVQAEFMQLSAQSLQQIDQFMQLLARSIEAKQAIHVDVSPVLQLTMPPQSAAPVQPIDLQLTVHPPEVTIEAAAQPPPAATPLREKLIERDAAGSITRIVERDMPAPEGGDGG